MKTFKIELKDKAAFINRCKKYGVAIDSFDLVDNELEGYFEFDVHDDKTVDVLRQILSKAPKISFLHTAKSKKKITKEQLVRLIREEIRRIV
jgi:hypothetical protein